MSTQSPWKRFAFIFFPLAGLAGLACALFYYAEWKAVQTRVEAKESQEVKLISQIMLSELEVMCSDLLFLSQHPALKELLAGTGSEQRLAQNYLVLSQNRYLYDQIRLLDIQGKEWVRVNFNAGQPRVIPQEGLQEKKTRPYFQEALALKPGQIYLSPLDLNIEYGEIQQPHKPVIRAATPVFDHQQRKQGVVVINYLGTRLFDKFQEALSKNNASEYWFIGAEGTWRLELNPQQKKWKFIYPEFLKRQFSRSYPLVWEQIKPKEQGQLYLQKSLFTFTTINLPTGMLPLVLKSLPSVKPWKVISRLSLSFLPSVSKAYTIQLLSFYAVLLVGLALVAWRLAQEYQRREVKEKEVALSENRFRSLFESAPDGIAITDPQGYIISVNIQAERLFGYPREELIGQEIEVLLPERYRRHHTAHRQGYTQNPTTRPMGIGLELYGRRKDGTEFPVEISLSPLKQERDFSIISTVRDISKRKQTEYQIRALNQKLQQHVAELSAVNTELEAFSYSVSHDLRAPLRSIDGFSQALLEDYEDQLDTEGQNYLHRVRAATKRMGDLIDDLLQLSRITRAEMRPQNVNLSHLAHEITTTLHTLEPQRQVDFCIDPDLTVQGDPHLLRIMLDNLLDNAWKFTLKQPQAQIHFGKTQKEENTVFFIQDNGAGFDMRYADKLFGAFQRLHSTHEYPGTGIGLATVQRIVHRHGGQIWAEGEINQGATFYFTLNI